MSTTSYSLGEISEKIHARLKGDPQCRIDRAEPLHIAKAGAISFLANVRYRSFLTNTQASAVILRAEDAQNCPINALITSNPELAFARLLNFLYPGPPIASGIHTSAVIGENCQIDPRPASARTVLLETESKSARTR